VRCCITGVKTLWEKVSTATMTEKPTTVDYLKKAVIG
jgi:hypothetical protein